MRLAVSGATISDTVCRVALYCLMDTPFGLGSSSAHFYDLHIRMRRNGGSTVADRGVSTAKPPNLLIGLALQLHSLLF